MVRMKSFLTLAAAAVLGSCVMTANAQVEYIYGFSGSTPNILKLTLGDGSSVEFSTADSQFTSGVNNQGWWSPTAGNGDTNDNYIVGQIGDSFYNDFFTFDLSNLAGDVVSAQLCVLPYEILSDSGDSLQHLLFDVSTDAATLNFNEGTSQAIFDDLGSGKGYGSRTFLESESYGADYIPIDLNGDAVGDINAARGGFFSIGGTLHPQDPVVPEPGTVALLVGLGVSGLVALRRRRK